MPQTQQTTLETGVLQAPPTIVINGEGRRWEAVRNAFVLAALAHPDILSTFKLYFS